MSISLCPLDIHIGSHVIPAEKLKGNQNPLGKIDDASTGFKHQGIDLLKKGNPREAKSKFLKMFNCKELKVEDFEAVGKALTNPMTEKSEIQMDRFAKKFLKQARELGSTDPVVYERLSKLYFQKGSYDKAGLESERFKILSPNNKAADELFIKCYRVFSTPITNRSIEIALDLATKPEYTAVANNILTKGAIRNASRSRTVRYLVHESKTYPTRSRNYSQIKAENRKAMATHFYNTIKNNTVNNNGPIKTDSPYDLLKNRNLKDLVVSLAVMESIEMQNMKNLCGGYLAKLGLNSTKVIDKATTIKTRHISYT